MFKKNVGGPILLVQLETGAASPFLTTHLSKQHLLVDYGKAKTGSASCCLRSKEGFETVNDAMIQSV